MVGDRTSNLYWRDNLLLQLSKEKASKWGLTRQIIGAYLNLTHDPPSSWNLCCFSIHRSQPQDSPEAKASPPTLTFSIRKKRSIRGHKDYAIVWYDSKAEGAVTADIFAGIRLSSPIRIGELVVHRYGDSGLQVFLCEEDPGALGMDNRRWTQIQSGHKHPFLRGHAFNMTPSGIPSWVRSETLTTYSGPKRQKRREETSN